MLHPSPPFSSMAFSTSVFLSAFTWLNGACCSWRKKAVAIWKLWTVLRLMPLMNSKSFIQLYLHWKILSVWDEYAQCFDSYFAPQVSGHTPLLLPCVPKVEVLIHIYPCVFSNLCWYFWIIIVSCCLHLQFFPTDWLPCLSLPM